MSYGVDEILYNIDTRTMAVLGAGFVIFLGAFIQYGEAIRLGFRHRTHAIPVFANMYFFAHDVAFAALYQRWFHEIGHWMYKAFWGGLIVFTLLECVVHYQTLKYSRKELFPRLTQHQYVVVYVLMQIGVGVVFLGVFSVLNDPLFLLNFAVTEVLSNVFNIALLRSRRSRKGQSLLMATGLLIGSNIGFFFLFLPSLSDSFATWPIRLVGASVTVLNLVYLWMLSQTRPYEEEQRMHSSTGANQQTLDVTVAEVV